MIGGSNPLTGIQKVSSGNTGAVLTLNTFVNLFAVPPNGQYLCVGTCQIGDASYSFMYFFTIDTTAAGNISGLGANMGVQISGGFFQAKQTASGGTLSCQWTLYKLQ